MQDEVCTLLDPNEHNMIHHAAQEGHTPVLVIENWSSLSDKKCDIHPRSNDSYTMMHWAVQEGHTQRACY